MKGGVGGKEGKMERVGDGKNLRFLLLKWLEKEDHGKNLTRWIRLGNLVVINITILILF